MSIFSRNTRTFSFPKQSPPGRPGASGFSVLPAIRIRLWLGTWVHLGTLQTQGGERATTLLPCGFGRWSSTGAGTSGGTTAPERRWDDHCVCCLTPPLLFSQDASRPNKTRPVIRVRLARPDPSLLLRPDQ